MQVSTTKLSTKGQVVIPQSVRDELGLEEGDTFAVFAWEDSIHLRKIRMPSEEELERSFQEGQAFAREHGITRADVARAVKEVRKERRDEGRR